MEIDMFNDVKQYSIASFKKLKINFIAIPKTGTSSFLTSLIEKEYPEKIEEVLNKSHEYSHNRKFASYITPNEANNNNYLNVSITRNPVERVVSQYRDFFYGYKINHKTNGSSEFNNSWLEFKKTSPSLDDFLNFIIKYDEEYKDVHFRSQSWFLDNIVKNQCYLKLENIQDSIKKNNEIQKLKLNVYNRNITNNIKNITVNEKLKEKIETIYYKDLILWKESL